jgi:hypothetical protein
MMLPLQTEKKMIFTANCLFIPLSNVGCMALLDEWPTVQDGDSCAWYDGEARNITSRFSKQIPSGHHSSY